MDQLPLIILLHIAEYSLDTWKSFVFSHPRVGRWSLNSEYQKYIQRKYTQCTEYQQTRYGMIKDYKLCNKYHNVDGPAIEYKNGTREWYTGGEHGLLHRDGDLPAVEWGNGTKQWYTGGNMVYSIETVTCPPSSVRMEPNNGIKMVDVIEIVI